MFRLQPLALCALLACPSAPREGETTSGGDQADDRNEDQSQDIHLSEDQRQPPGRALSHSPDPCTMVTPEPNHHGMPVFSNGDPCENVNPSCAWDSQRRRCVTFTRIDACPALLEQAEHLSLRCDHSGQPALQCSYGPTNCGCARTPYCGGAAPPPSVQYPPAIFGCVPPVDAQGCPTGAIDDGSPCDVDASVTCMRCAISASCVGGRWRVQQLPPRP